MASQRRVILLQVPQGAIINVRGRPACLLHITLQKHTDYTELYLVFSYYYM